MDEREVDVLGVIKKLDSRVDELRWLTEYDHSLVGDKWGEQQMKDWAYRSILSEGALNNFGLVGNYRDRSQWVITKTVARHIYERNSQVLSEWMEEVEPKGDILKKLTIGKNQKMLLREAKRMLKDKKST